MSLYTKFGYDMSNFVGGARALEPDTQNLL